MKCEWKYSTIGEACLLVTDGSHFSPKSVSDGQYMVSVKDFTAYGFDFSNCRQINDEDYQRLEKAGCVPEYEDVLVGKDGARYFEDIIVYRQSERPALLSSIAILRCDTKEILPDYLYYLMKDPTFKQDIRDNYGSGSAIPRIILKDFKRMPIKYPCIGKQERIISILRSLDDKIELNNKINENLEQQAQAIYQEWFGDVDAAKEQGTLSDICSYSKDRVAVSELDICMYFSTENMLPEKAGATEASSLPTAEQTTACHAGDTLVSNIRPYFKKIVYCHEACGCSADVLCFVPVDSKYSAYLYSTLYADNFFDFMVAGSKGTKMPRGDKQQIMTYPVTLPTDEELDRFNLVAVPILEQIQNNRNENKTLSLLRDNLLPKLLSGEVSVDNV